MVHDARELSDGCQSEGVRRSVDYDMYNIYIYVYINIISISISIHSSHVIPWMWLIVGLILHQMITTCHNRTREHQIPGGHFEASVILKHPGGSF